MHKDSCHTLIHYSCSHVWRQKHVFRKNVCLTTTCCCYASSPRTQISNCLVFYLVYYAWTILMFCLASLATELLKSGIALRHFMYIPFFLLPSTSAFSFHKKSVYLLPVFLSVDTPCYWSADMSSLSTFAICLPNTVPCICEIYILYFGWWRSPSYRYLVSVANLGSQTNFVQFVLDPLKKWNSTVLTELCIAKTPPLTHAKTNRNNKLLQVRLDVTVWVTNT